VHSLPESLRAATQSCPVPRPCCVKMGMVIGYGLVQPNPRRRTSTAPNALACERDTHGKLHPWRIDLGCTNPQWRGASRLARNSSPASSFILNDKQDRGHGGAKHCERPSASAILSAQIRKLAATAHFRRPYFAGEADGCHEGNLCSGETRTRRSDGRELQHPTSLTALTVEDGARKSRRIFLQRAGRTLRGASTTTSRMIACCWSQPVLPSLRNPGSISRNGRHRVALRSFYGATTISGYLNLISGFLPEGALEVIGDQVKRIASQGQRALGAAFLGTLAFSLWGANSGTKAIFDALNIIYKEQEKRSFLQLTIRSFIFTIGAVALVLLALAGIIAVPVIIKLLGVPDWSGAALLSKRRWPLLYVVILFALACLYRYGPSRTHPQWKWVTLGSAIAGGVIGSLLLSWYVGNFGSYNATYGSLGAVIGFMVWMWFSTIIVLVGGEINADTTEGRKRPMGSRGAKMADELGEART
jgi:YihY family inner membrane protein